MRPRSVACPRSDLLVETEDLGANALGLLVVLPLHAVGRAIVPEQTVPPARHLRVQVLAGHDPVVDLTVAAAQACVDDLAWRRPPRPPPVAPCPGPVRLGVEQDVGAVLRALAVENAGALAERVDFAGPVQLLEARQRDLQVAPDLSGIGGRIEGEAAASYFAAFPQLITCTDPAFTFTGRNRRPPTDPVNALLSFVYTLLVHDCRSALEGVGLDPCVGYLHTDRPGRPSLALDLMEEFRAFLADRLVLSLINRRQIQPKDFNDSAGGAVAMTDDARKTLLSTWQKRKQEEITHPYLGEKCKIGLLPHVQAQLLARHLRGDLEAYPPFIWR